MIRDWQGLLLFNGRGDGLGLIRAGDEDDAEGERGTGDNTGEEDHELRHRRSVPASL